tara:strand:+ start:136 stop:1158 length:1023 start_codon:yes stop_codon:yes gene_type:complete
MSNKPPIEVPQGAIRLNTDSQRLEFYAQDKWYEFAIAHQTAKSGSCRGVLSGRYTPTNLNTIDYVNLTTAGNATDFGDQTQSRSHCCTASSSTRGLIMGGQTPSKKNRIDFITIASAGDAIDFGNLTQSITQATGASNHVRAVRYAGQTPSNINVIDFGEIDFPGDFVDFGDARAGTAVAAGCESNTRAVFVGGEGALTNMGHIIFASTGDEVAFGDILGNSGGSLRYARGASNGVRGLVMGGLNPSPSGTNEIMQLDITSLGNAYHFGDLVVAGTSARNVGGTTSNKIRAIYAGGDDGTNEIATVEYVSFATMGNSSDFGELTQAGGGINGLSDGHGGL